MAALRHEPERPDVRARVAELPEVCCNLSRSHVENMVDAARVMLDKFHVSSHTFDIELARGP